MLVDAAVRARDPCLLDPSVMPGQRSDGGRCHGSQRPVSDARASEGEIGHVDLFEHLNGFAEVAMSPPVASEPQRESSRVITRELSFAPLSKLVRGLRPVEVIEDGGPSWADRAQSTPAMDDCIDWQRDDVADVEVRHEVVDDPWMGWICGSSRGRSGERKDRTRGSSWTGGRRSVGGQSRRSGVRKSGSGWKGCRRRRSRAYRRQSLNGAKLGCVSARVVNELLSHERGGDAHLAVLKRVAAFATIPHWKRSIPARWTGSNRQERRSAQIHRVHVAVGGGDDPLQRGDLRQQHPLVVELRVGLVVDVEEVARSPTLWGWNESRHRRARTRTRCSRLTWRDSSRCVVSSSDVDDEAPELLTRRR